jgi:hypothetical protein
MLSKHATPFLQHLVSRCYLDGHNMYYDHSFNHELSVDGCVTSRYKFKLLQWMKTLACV